MRTSWRCFPRVWPFLGPHMFFALYITPQKDRDKLLITIILVGFYCHSSIFLEVFFSDYILCIIIAYIYICIMYIVCIYIVYICIYSIYINIVYMYLYISIDNIWRKKNEGHPLNALVGKICVFPWNYRGSSKVSLTTIHWSSGPILWN